MSMFNKEHYQETRRYLEGDVAGTLADYYCTSDGSIDFNTEVKPRIERVRVLTVGYIAYLDANRETASLVQITDSARAIAELMDGLDSSESFDRRVLMQLSAMLADVTELLYKKCHVAPQAKTTDTLFDD